MSEKRFRFAIDRGGTFTDIYCEVVETATGNVLKKPVLKLLSEDPQNYKDAPTEGIRRLLEAETGIPHPRSSPVDTSRIEFIRMGTTVATNALLERKGERIALLTTAGFGDLQLIGNQSRPKIFDLQIKRPDRLYEMVTEIGERVVLVKDHNKGDFPESEVVVGKSHELLFVEQALNTEEVTGKLREILATGIKSLAVVFLHSYTYPKHEETVKEIAVSLGFEQVSISSEVMPMIRAVPRGCTTCVDAYLTPVIKKYLKGFSAGFDEGLAQVNVSFMQSDGGLTPMSNFLGNKAILSGPAGGVVGYAITSEQDHASRLRGNGAVPPLNVIGFDMGGTSTDVSRYAGAYEHVFESTTAGVTIQSPQLDINTVAAGGGSRLFYKNGLFVVGPESAGAHPGPVCYRKGGPLTVTDANVFLGRVQPHLFPAIFGPHENEPLDVEGTRRAFEELTADINKDSQQHGKTYTAHEVAYGFIRIANEAMARPIRNLTTMKGYDVTKHSLACFGGAGPQHCCAIAKSLGMSQVLVHRYSGILSAYGLSLADVVVEKQEPFNSGEVSESLTLANERLATLEKDARAELQAQGFQPASIEVTRYLNCRYTGTDTASMTSVDARLADGREPSYEQEFTESYRREYGFELQGRRILVDDVRVRAVGKADTLLESSSPVRNPEAVAAAVPDEEVQTFFDDALTTTPVFHMHKLLPGQVVQGPAIIVQNVATVVVEPNCRADITPSGDISISVHRTSNLRLSTEVDPIYLSVFGHRFMGIAEQMGRTLQRTSVSVNIKERLDFSCALFDPAGGLVANAPHLPVHLGAMSEAVRYQVKYWGDNISEGDVLVSNHPQLAGGSHLPDITVITPIFT
jgi:5-oxoprolinase (ATP-hydrolysing)